MNEFEKKCKYGHTWQMVTPEKAKCTRCDKEQILDYSNEV